MGFWDFLTGTTPGGAAASTAKAVVDSTFSGIDKIIRDYKLPPEAQLAYEQFKAGEATKLMEMAAGDVASARQMEAATRSRMPALLASFYTVAFIGLSAGLLYYAFAMPNVVMNNFQAGLVGTIYGSIMKEAMLGSTFYLGGTQQAPPMQTDEVAKVLGGNDK